MNRKFSKIPSVVQLPGGIKLSAIPFKVIEHDSEGRPIKFEILPPGSNGDWYLYGDERLIR